MNEGLKKLVSQIKDLWTKWSIVQKVVLIGIAVAVIVALVLVVNLSSKTTEVPLFSVAVTDETIQYFTSEGRAMRITDMIIDTAGVVFATLVFYFFWKLFYYKKKKEILK